MSAGSSSRSLELVLLCGAVLACGAMAVSLLPIALGSGTLQFGIVALLATPWAAAVVIGVEALRTGSIRRALFVVALLLLGSLSLFL